jgi:hypothetical protein
MRRMIAGPTVLAVLFGFWGAPFLHLHAVTVRTDHHGAAVEFHHEKLIHAHLPVATSHSTVTVGSTEEDEKPLDIFRAVTTSSAAVAPPFVVPVRVSLAPPVVAPARVFLPLSPRTHDPPSLSQLVPRAPPA